METLLQEAQLKKISRVKDGSVTFSFQTAREVTTDEYMLMDKYWQQNGWVAFKLNQVEANDIPEADAITGAKSESVQLRMTIFAKFMALGGKKEAFPPYYHRHMQSIMTDVNNSYDR